MSPACAPCRSWGPAAQSCSNRKICAFGHHPHIQYAPNFTQNSSYPHQRLAFLKHALGSVMEMRQFPLPNKPDLQVPSNDVWNFPALSTAAWLVQGLICSCLWGSLRQQKEHGRKWRGFEPIFNSLFPCNLHAEAQVFEFFQSSEISSDIKSCFSGLYGTT